MDKKISVKSISIEIGKRELVLTPTEAETLHKALSDLLGKPVTTYAPFWRYWDNNSSPIIYASTNTSEDIKISCLTSSGASFSDMARALDAGQQ
jgi:hypothetical protein